MILQIKKYCSNETLILVSEIVTVDYNEYSNSDKLNNLAETQYEFTVTRKDGTNLRFWYNGEEERCLAEYQKTKDALLYLYKKDTIKEEIRSYLQSMAKGDINQ